MKRASTGFALICAFAGMTSLLVSLEASVARAADLTTQDMINALTPTPTAQQATRGLTIGGGGSTPPVSNQSARIPDLQVTFEFDSADLTAEAREVLDRLGAALRSDTLRHFHFRIAGHTDALGSDAYNDALSARRAEAVRDYLATVHNVEPRRLESIGLGERELAVPSEPAAAENRRVEIINLDS